MMARTRGEQMMRQLCSGLGSIAPCEKRDQCANYVHWTQDPRSKFNICTVTGDQFKHYVQRGAQIAQTAQKVESRQESLF